MTPSRGRRRGSAEALGTKLIVVAIAMAAAACMVIRKKILRYMGSVRCQPPWPTSARPRRSVLMIDPGANLGMLITKPSGISSTRSMVATLAKLIHISRRYCDDPFEG